MGNKSGLIISLLFILVFTSCGSDDPTDPPPPQEQLLETIISENAKVMDEEAFTVLQSTTDAFTTFTFQGTSPYLDELTVDDIIVSGINDDHAEYGFLRKVTNIETAGGTTTVTTADAYLYEAIKQTSIRFDTGPLEKSQVKRMDLAPGAKLLSLQKSDEKFEAFNFSFDHLFGTESNGVLVSGETYLDISFFMNFDWEFVLDLPPFEVKLFKTGVNIDQGSSIMVEGHGSYNDEEEFIFADIEFYSWTIMIGPVPVVFTLTAELFINIDGQISANITTGASENFTVDELGLKYTSDDGWSTMGETTFETDFIIPSPDADVSLRASAGPRVNLLIYEAGGPYVGVEAYTLMEAELLADDHFNMNFDLGVRAFAGARLGAHGFNILDYQQEIFDVPWDLFDLVDGTTEESISIISPIGNAEIPVETALMIEAYFTGQPPAEVAFYANGTELGRDTTAPFAYEWNTTSADLGTVALMAQAIYSDHELDSASVNINVVDAGWDVLNLKAQIPGLPTYCAISDIVILDESHIWMSTGLDDGRTFFSSNQGDSWAQIYDGSGAVNRMHDVVYINSTTGFSVTGSNHDFCYTDDGGSTWFDDVTWVGPSMTTYTVFPYTAGSDALFISYGYGPGSTDSGEGIGWVNRTNGTELVLTDYKTFAEMTSEPLDEWAGSLDRELFSKGSTIFVTNLKTTSSDVSRLGIVNGGSMQIIDVGFTYDDAEIDDIFFLDDSQGWLLTNESFLYKTINGGYNWTLLYGEIGGGGLGDKIFFVDANTGYCTRPLTGIEQAKILMTTNGGITWTGVEESVRFDGMRDVEFLGPSLGFAAGASSFLEDGAPLYIYRYSVRGD